MFENMKSLVSATAFGLVLLAGHTAQATTFNIGAMPFDGTTLSFTGDTTDGPDIFNFTLPVDVDGISSYWLHMETGSADYDTWIELYSGFNLSGVQLAFDDDSTNTFGPCASGNYQCSSIGAGNDQLERDYGVNATPLPAGDYSLEVKGYYNSVGNYELRITSATIPEPGTLVIFGLGLAGLAVARRRKRA